MTVWSDLPDILAQQRQASTERSWAKTRTEAPAAFILLTLEVAKLLIAAPGRRQIALGEGGGVHRNLGHWWQNHREGSNAQAPRESRNNTHPPSVVPRTPGKAVASPPDYIPLL